MKYKDLRKCFLVPLGLVLSVVFAAHAFAANTAKFTDGDLGKLHAASGVKCAQCHENVKKPEGVSMEKCLTCHGDSKALAARTANAKPRNPHESRHYGTEADCNLCHHQHRKSENFCLQCHKFNFQVP
jgi:hypothetical protein